ncbi:MAG: phage minor tail protein L [Ramlibacter sp.]|nr:phage minor tail protein L [Ramlibacter sp.]
MTNIAGDVSRLEISAPVELYELDAAVVGGGVHRFANMTNELGTAVVWQGQSYSPFPIEVTGFENSSDGPLARPRLSVSNVNGMVGALIRDYQRLEGASFIRRRTLAKYLDAANFALGVNPTADPTAHWPDELWLIDRVDQRNKSVVVWELCSPLDWAGVMLPRRQILAAACAWRYRGSECGYTGGPVAKADDSATSDPAADSCGRRLTSCKLRFGATAELPFGGFPGAGTTRNV